MTKTIVIQSEKIVYSGYNRLGIYDLKVPSFDQQTDYVQLGPREVLHSRDSVIVLIYAPQSDSVVFCQQFRPGIYFNKAQDLPFPLECVAGSIDGNQPPEDVARKEVMEETGITVESLKLICTAYASPGISTEKNFIYFAEISGEPQGQIGGNENEGEDILTHVIKRQSVYEMMDKMAITDCKSLLALNWFRRNFP